ncbi:Pol-like protein [Plakobranchus ocellatus]|uniref:Pol-like protein n=1 Tax=Plakobranchus ocellatus TaxID=259542 RepID=A0AAV3ZUX4_9GAST|nr:Pol-like protein [Plakobranchus ocellatus]
MDTVVQQNIRGFRSNFEELLNRSQSAVVALQCKLTEGHSPPRSYTLLLPQETLLIKNRIRFSEIGLKTGLHAVAATINPGKTLPVCSLYLPPYTPVSKLSLANSLSSFRNPFSCWETSMRILLRGGTPAGMGGGGCFMAENDLIF